MYPTTRWAAGEAVQDYYELEVPRGLAPGRYVWAVVVYYQASDGAFVQLRDRQGNTLVQGGDIDVVTQAQY
jgi:hypothetical protein